jgi:hypothetical protein
LNYWISTVQDIWNHCKWQYHFAENKAVAWWFHTIMAPGQDKCVLSYCDIWNDGINLKGEKQLHMETSSLYLNACNMHICFWV